MIDVRGRNHVYSCEKQKLTCFDNGEIMSAEHSHLIKSSNQLNFGQNVLLVTVNTVQDSLLQCGTDKIEDHLLWSQRSPVHPGWQAQSYLMPLVAVANWVHLWAWTHCDSLQGERSWQTDPSKPRGQTQWNPRPSRSWQVPPFMHMFFWQKSISKMRKWLVNVK